MKYHRFCLFTETNKTNFELMYLRTNSKIYPAVNLNLCQTDQDLATNGETRGKKEEHKILAFDKDK